MAESIRSMTVLAFRRTGRATRIPGTTSVASCPCQSGRTVSCWSRVGTARGDITLPEGLSRALQGQKNYTSEVRIFDKADHDDAEFITRIFKLCILGNATGCTTSDSYGTDRGGKSATAADIYLNWDRLTDVSGDRTSYDAGTLNPGMENIQFNQCHSPPGTSLDSRAFELVIHEAGHALGMSGASPPRSLAQGTIDLINALLRGALSDLIDRFGGDDVDYTTSHPTVASTVLNYASFEKEHGVEGEPDCFPHPLDVLAINALYQDGYEQPVFGPFSLATSIRGGGGRVTISPARPAGGYYDDGTKVTVTAWDTVGHAFEGWEGACAHAATSTICRVTMDNNKSVSAMFSTTEADEAPSFGSASFTLTRAPGAMFHFIPLPTATGGNGTLSYSLSSSNQPDWLVFAPAPPTISTRNPIPASAAGINYTMTLTVVDSDSNTGSSDRDSVTINVTVSPISGSFRVEGEGSSQVGAETAADLKARAEAGGLGVVAYWRTQNSVSSETTTTAGYTASGDYNWVLTETLRHDGVGYYDTASEAESAARVAASAAIPEGATLTSVTIYWTGNFPDRGGWVSAADATYQQEGSVEASGVGDDRNAAISAALSDAQSQAPAGATVNVVTVTTARNTSTEYTASQLWRWNTDQDSSPTSVTINLAVRPSWNQTMVIWPVPTAAIGTATQGVPLSGIWYYRGDNDWDVYLPGAPSFVNSISQLVRGRHYNVRVTAAHTWVVSSVSRTTRGAPAVQSNSGWRATVICENGPGRIRLGVAPTEAQAIGAATWFINSRDGCGGTGTYTVSRIE